MADAVVAVRRGDGEAVLTVRDQGPGIDPAQWEHIFERFVQGKREDRHATQGLGLGLYIAREIVRAHNGTFDVDSAPGVKTTFTIRLPLGMAAVTSPEAEGLH